MLRPSTRTPHARSKDSDAHQSARRHGSVGVSGTMERGERTVLAATAAVPGPSTELDGLRLSATCLHSFARVDHGGSSGSMKTLIQIARDVIVPLASVGCARTGATRRRTSRDPRIHPRLTSDTVLLSMMARGAPRAPTPSGHPWNC